MRRLKIEILPGEFAICRLAPDAAIPPWALGNGLASITRTADELSILCAANNVPAEIKREAGWRALKFAGPFAFTETGVLSSVLAPLAEAKISILAISTFETDYVLVKTEQLEGAAAALRAAGHLFALS